MPIRHFIPLRRATRGFTLIELMITVALLAIGLALGTPYIRDAVMNMRMTAQANDLMADLALARSEAVKRNVSVLLCTSIDGTTCGGTSWTDGWIVFPDVDGNGAQNLSGTPAPEAAIKSRPELQGDYTVQTCGDTGSGPRFVAYRPSGISIAGNINFVICDDRTTPLAGRSIDILRTGRAAVTRVTCPRTPSCT